MARPAKYNWEEIKQAYEGGFDRAEICKKYKITAKNLSNKINEDKWKIVGTIKHDINEFQDSFRKLMEHSLNSTKIEELIIEKINTQKEDNELIGNNRKLAKMLQGVILSKRNEINLNNIKSVSGTLRDIETMANPSTNVSIQNSNNIQTIEVEID